MLHVPPLVSTIAIGLVLAFAFGVLAHRFKLPPLVGYLVAGIVIGPFTPGFVADQNIAIQLAEVGVILLMFGVGLHFSLKDLLSVRAIAVPGALALLAATVTLLKSMTSAGETIRSFIDAIKVWPPASRRASCAMRISMPPNSPEQLVIRMRVLRRCAASCRRGRHVRDPEQGHALDRLRRRLRPVLAGVRPAGRDRGRGELHLPAAAAGDGR